MTVDATDYYEVPAAGWCCFHCGEIFPPTLAGQKAAHIHFGAASDKKPGCLLKLEAEDRRLLKQLRFVEFERDELEVRLTALRLGANEDECIKRFRAQRKFVP